MYIARTNRRTTQTDRLFPFQNQTLLIRFVAKVFLHALDRVTFDDVLGIWRRKFDETFIHIKRRIPQVNFVRVPRVCGDNQLSPLLQLFMYRFHFHTYHLVQNYAPFVGLQHATRHTRKVTKHIQRNIYVLNVRRIQTL